MSSLFLSLSLLEKVKVKVKVESSLIFDGQGGANRESLTFLTQTDYNLFYHYFHHLFISSLSSSLFFLALSLLFFSCWGCC